MEKDKPDWSKLIPERIINWEIHPETNFVIIKKPKFKNFLLKKYLLPRLRKQNYTVNLDKIGSFVWMNIDGKVNFGDIAEKMRKEFGESVEPVDDRLGQFINSLRKYDFITFKNFDVIASDKT